MEEIEAPTTEQQSEQQPAPKPLSLLAQEKFGNAFKGEVKEIEQQGEQQSAETETEVETEIEVQTDAETHTETQAETETDQETTGEEESQEENITSFSQLVENQQWDEEWAKGLTETIKVDGQERQVTRSEMIASFQTQEAATKNLNEAKESGRVQNEALALKDEQATLNLNVTASLVQEAESILAAEKASPELEALRTSDPAEWTARNTKIINRQAKIDAVKSGAVTQYSKVQQEIKTEQENAHMAHVAQEGLALVKAIPSWSDQEVANTERKEIGDYLVANGFLPKEVSLASDHRLIVLARKARLFDESQSKTKIAAKKVVKIPKTAKPGAQKTATSSNQQKLAQAKSNLRKSGSMEDGRAVLAAKRLLG